MNNLSFKQKIIGIIAALGIGLIAIFQPGLYSKANINPKNEPGSSILAPDNRVVVLLTDPAPLDESTILPTQTISIVFNKAVENTGELKSSIDPIIDYEVKLSDDRKTAFVKPKTAYKLGQGYTFSIYADTKFDDKKRLEQDYTVHFQTISYKGV